MMTARHAVISKKLAKNDSANRFDRGRHCSKIVVKILQWLSDAAFKNHNLELLCSFIKSTSIAQCKLKLIVKNNFSGVKFSTSDFAYTESLFRCVKSEIFDPTIGARSTAKGLGQEVLVLNSSQSSSFWRHVIR